MNLLCLSGGFCSPFVPHLLKLNISKKEPKTYILLSIGIDIERVRDDVAIEQIAQRFFSQGEISSLDRIHRDKRTEVFFQYWTRKEAFLKATGEGMSFPMEQCDVSILGGRVLSPITLLGDNRESSYWYGQDLFPGGGYAAALAVEGDDWDLSCWHYSV